MSGVRSSLKIQMLSLRPSGGISQTVGFTVEFTSQVRDGEIEGPCQFPTGPVQRIQTWAPADVFPSHLLHNYLRIGIDVKDCCLEVHGALQSLKQCDVFGYV